MMEMQAINIQHFIQKIKDILKSQHTSIKYMLKEEEILNHQLTIGKINLMERLNLFLQNLQKIIQGLTFKITNLKVTQVKFKKYQSKILTKYKYNKYRMLKKHKNKFNKSFNKDKK